MTRISYRVLKERRCAYFHLVPMKRRILASWSIYLMQPQADIDEIESETMIQTFLYLLFQWLTLFQQMNSGSLMDLEQNIPALAIAMSPGPDKASTLPMFHATTGCDTVSFFGGRGKKRLGTCGTCFLDWHQCLKSSKHHQKRSQRNAWLCLRGLLSLYMTVKQPYESNRGATKALLKEV